MIVKLFCLQVVDLFPRSCCYTRADEVELYFLSQEYMSICPCICKVFYKLSPFCLLFEKSIIFNPFSSKGERISQHEFLVCQHESNINQHQYMFQERRKLLKTDVPNSNLYDNVSFFASFRQQRFGDG